MHEMHEVFFGLSSCCDKHWWPSLNKQKFVYKMLRLRQNMSSRSKGYWGPAYSSSVGAIEP